MTDLKDRVHRTIRIEIPVASPTPPPVPPDTIAGILRILLSLVILWFVAAPLALVAFLPNILYSAAIRLAKKIDSTPKVERTEPRP